MILGCPLIKGRYLDLFIYFFWLHKGGFLFLLFTEVFVKLSSLPFFLSANVSWVKMQYLSGDAEIENVLSWPLANANWTRHRVMWGVF